jgi:hypothetical protein
MDQIAAFQSWLGAPVMTLLAAYWFVPVFVAVAVAGWFVLPRRVREDGGGMNWDLGDDGDGDGGD